MEFRIANKFDIDEIMEIIKQAQVYLKNSGIDQWQNGYPNRDTILDDISKGYTYILTEDSKVIGTAAVIFDGEITYQAIYDGNWLTLDDYAVIHRIAIATHLKGNGLANQILKNIEQLCRNRGVCSIKIDTHEDNRSMQRFLLKSGFSYCGYIYLLDGNKRLAYEKSL